MITIDEPTLPSEDSASNTPITKAFRAADLVKAALSKAQPFPTKNATHAAKQIVRYITQ